MQFSLPSNRTVKYRYKAYVSSESNWSNRYDDVIMGAMTSLITSLTIVYTRVYLGADKKKTSKFRLTSFCVGNSPVTGEFPT